MATDWLRSHTHTHKGRDWVIWIQNFQSINRSVHQHNPADPTVTLDSIKSGSVCVCVIENNKVWIFETKNKKQNKISAWSLWQQQQVKSPKSHSSIVLPVNNHVSCLVEFIQKFQKKRKKTFKRRYRFFCRCWWFWNENGKPDLAIVHWWSDLDHLMTTNRKKTIMEEKTKDNHYQGP